MAESRLALPLPIKPLSLLAVVAAVVLKPTHRQPRQAQRVVTQRRLPVLQVEQAVQVALSGALLLLPLRAMTVPVPVVVEAAVRAMVEQAVREAASGVEVAVVVVRTLVLQALAALVATATS